MFKYARKFIVANFIVLLLCLSAKAQNEGILFDRLSLEQGLSQSSVFTILQDYKGFMWFGTLDGLNKFDGYKFTIYRNKANDSLSISDNSITVLFEDRQKNLWVGTRSEGLCIYNNQKDNFKRIKSTVDDVSANDLISNKIVTIYQDKKEVIWVGTNNGISKITKNSEGGFDFENINVTTTPMLLSNKIKCITGDKYGNIYIGTNKGLNVVQPNLIGITKVNQFIDKEVNAVLLDKKEYLWVATNTSVKMALLRNVFDTSKSDFWRNFDDILPLNEGAVNDLLEDDLGDIWIGTEKTGLSKLVRTSIEHAGSIPEIDTYRYDPVNQRSLSADNVLSIYQDNANSIWVGISLGGLNRWNRVVGGLDLYRHKPYNKNSLSSSQIRSIYQDHEGVFWIGTVDGGLNRWNTEEGIFKAYKHNSFDVTSLSNNHVRTVLEDKKGQLWVGTNGGGLELFDKKTEQFKHFVNNPADNNTLSNNNVWKVYQDKQEVLWIATFGGGLNKFDAQTETFKAYKHDENDQSTISDNLITTIFEDSKNNFWVGTYGGGLNLFDRDKGTFKAFSLNKNDTNSIGNNRIYSIFEDSDGVIWIGTKGSLNRYNADSKTFSRFDERHGLPNNVIMGILEDRNENLWLSTNSGICRFDADSMHVRNYDIRDGLQSNEFLVGSYFKTSEGRMFFGGINGFNTFYPEQIKDNPHRPKVSITRFRVFNKDIALDTNITEKKQITLSYSQNVFSFDFVALNFIFPEKNQYSYFMDGFDKDWNNVRTQRHATYTNLPPGNYKFRVKGANNAGEWGKEETVISVIITPPFWKTTWFYILVTGLLIAGIILYIKIRERKLQQDNIRLEETVKQRTTELREQKEEVEKQRDIAHQQNIEISRQKQKIEAQRDLANEQKRNITDNIQYASHIQEAILPPEEFFVKVFPDHFILYKPKDIVSGDYYWMAQKGNKIYFAVADCTGHGVSGAFMSMLGVSFLNAIMYKHIDNDNELHLNAGQILDELRENVKQSLHKTGKENQAQGRVGMDIAMAIFNTKDKTLQYAGAYNPLYVVRRNAEAENGVEFIQFKANKMPIGFFFKEKPFVNHEFQLEKEDTIYIFSDGYIDQFGGDKKRRFLTKNFTRVLQEINHENMRQQRKILNENFETWKGDYEQVDDVLVMGIRIP